MRAKALSAVGVALLLASLVGLSGCGSAEDPWKDVPGSGPRVLAAFPPLYCFAKNVGGDDAAVMALLTTTGPHDFKPTAHDMLKARDAHLFLAVGLTLDDFVTKVANNSGNSRNDFVHLVGEAIPKEKRIPRGEHDHKHDGVECKHCCGHGEFDPHVWLGIDEAVVMVNRISELLQAENPAKKDAYRDRAAKYVDELRKLEAEGKALLATSPNRKFIANHDSFKYFARSFGLTCVDSIQVQPGIATDAVKLKKLIEVCKAEGVKVIGVEPQYSDAAAKALQSALLREGVSDVRIVTLDPLETAERSELTPGFYVERMRSNLKNLAGR
jgi:zinc transport system substrate-binding protein